MFFRCIDNKVIPDNVAMVHIYKRKEDAETVVKQRNTHMIWEDKTKPVPVEKVEGFFLVHESLYDEILKKFDKEQ